jgi:uncharacterized damage-inducible protein DinB
MQSDFLRYLVGFNEWADHIVLDAARRLSPDQLRASHQMGFGPVFDTLVHIMGAQWVWLRRLQGDSPKALPSANTVKDLDQLKAEWDHVHNDLRAFIAGLDETRLDGTVTYKTTKGEAYTQPLLLLILHVFNHSTEHRSQVAAMCAMAGYDVGALDLIHYMRTAGK